MRSNCLFWAVRQKLNYGGKVNIIKSQTWIGYHVTWTDKNGETWEYTVPRMRKRSWWYIPLFYNGVVKKLK